MEEDFSRVYNRRRNVQPEQWFIIATLIGIFFQALLIGWMWYSYPAMRDDIPWRLSVYFGVVDSGAYWHLFLYPLLSLAVFIVNGIVVRLTRQRFSALPLLLWGLSAWWTLMGLLILGFILKTFVIG